MNRLFARIFLIWISSAIACEAQLYLHIPLEPVPVFGGRQRKVPLQWDNRGAVEVNPDIRFTISTVTAGSNNAPLIEGPWKKMRVLPQQTVLETAVFDFPEVQKPTGFLLNFYNGRNALGLMFLHVYPTNLLQELKSLAGDLPLGLLEPENIFKPLFRTNGINFSDLEKTDLEHFNGRLAIFGSLHGTIGLPHVFTSKIPDLAKRGVAIVWIQPRARPSDPMRPSFYSLSFGKGAVVVVQQSYLAEFEANPVSQLHLLHCCRLALKPEPTPLPETRP